MNDAPTSLDESARRRLEADWKEGKPSDLSAYLPSPDDRRYLATLVELAGIDMEMRWRKRAAGGPPPPRVEDYILRFPQLTGEEILGELVQQEAILRARAGEAPTNGEYAERFPNLAESSLPTVVHRDVVAFARAPRIPDCEIVRELGRGGMGVVYLANQPSLQRQVAVKTVRYAGEANHQELLRFFHEAEAVGRLQHPNIVAIHHVSRDGGMPYFLMEYVEGGTLAKALQDGPLPPNQAASLVETLARAMEYAHQRGIIHRDLKPANILLVKADGGWRMAESKSGEQRVASPRAALFPKITDFGLAKSLDVDWQITQTGHVIGTPSYMAPEQAAGQTAQISTRTDVYALGAILYETLTGRPPFRDSAISATLQDVIHKEPDAPSRVRRGIPRDLETICLQCLNKDPSKRYARAELLADDLHRYLTHQPIHARRIGAWGIAARWCRRNPALASTLAASALVVTVVAGLGVWNVLKERDRLRIQRDIAEANLYRSLTTQAAGHLDSRGSEWWWKATDTLAAASQLQIPDRDAEELRNLYVRCLGTPYHSLRVLHTWSSRVGRPQRIAVSGNGHLCALAGSEGTIEVRELPAGDNPHTFPGHTKTTGLAFHPSRPVLYSCSIDGVLRATDLRSQGSQHTWQAKAGTELTTLALHPDGATLIAGTDSGGLLSFALNAEGLLEGEPKTIPGGTEAISGLTISPRGHEYVVADKANALTGRDWSDGRELWNRKTGNPLQALHYDATGYHLSFVDPLGFGFGIMLSYRMQPENFLHLHDNAVRRAFILRRGFLTASYDGSLRIWGREASRPLSLWASGQSEFGPLMDAELLPGESRVLAAYQDGSVRLWEIFEPAERAFFGSGNQTICIVGNRHEAFDGSGLFDLEGKKPPMLVDAADRHATAVWGVAASSDGQRMASCDHDGRVKVWDPVSRKAIATFRETEELVWCVAFRPNSSWLAGGFDKIAIWDTDRRELLMMLDGHKGLVASLVFHPKLPLLVSAGRDRFIRIWHLESKTLLAEYGPMETFANSVTFDPAGQWLAAGCEDGEVRLWKMESLEQARAYGPPKRTFSGHTSPVRAVAFSHNGLLASGAEQGIVLLRDADHDFRRLVRLQSGAGQIRSLQFSRDDRFLACGYYVSPGVAWDLPAVRKALAAVDLDW